MSRPPIRKHLKLNTLSQFSQALHKTLCSKKGYALLNDQFGWLDGGCWSLAHGLKLWLDDVQIHCVFDRAWAPQHVVVKVPDRNIFIDGSGLSTEETLKRVMEEDELVRAPAYVAPFKWQYSVETPNGIELNKDVAREVRRFLEGVFGEGPYFLWSLCEAEEDLETPLKKRQNHTTKEDYEGESARSQHGCHAAKQIWKGGS